ncbi:MAG: hypothetical protein ACRDRY_15850 [Pseudonocardiaceae bacterium]
MSWYLRSIGDADTHCGDLRDDGAVLGRCGVVFQPRQLPLGRLALPGQPQDRDQICPQCYRVTVTGHR